MIETIVDRLVIRDDDPREPHASESWLKMRAFAVAISPAMFAMAVTTWLEPHPAITLFLPIVLLIGGVKAVAGPINDRIEDLEEGGEP